MRLSIATMSLGRDLEGKATAISRAAFDGAEIFENDFVASDRTPREVGQMLSDNGLEVTAFQPFRDFEGLPAPIRQKASTGLNGSSMSCRRPARRCRRRRKAAAPRIWRGSVKATPTASRPIRQNQGQQENRP